jgi:hypothetical protein
MATGAAHLRIDRTLLRKKGAPNEGVRRSLAVVAAVVVAAVFIASVLVVPPIPLLMRGRC